jgi:hypothetical protein
MTPLADHQNLVPKSGDPYLSFSKQMEKKGRAREVWRRREGERIKCWILMEGDVVDLIEDLLIQSVGDVRVPPDQNQNHF